MALQHAKFYYSVAVEKEITAFRLNFINLSIFQNVLKNKNSTCFENKSTLQGSLKINEKKARKGKNELKNTKSR